MSQKSILIIDDDIELTGLLSDYLAGNDYKVNCKHKGDEGLREALEQGYDLILLDVMLPNLNGFDVLQRLRKNKATPVIMLTAKGEDYDRIFGLEAGADDYISKPFNHRELLARVKAQIRRVDLLTQVASHQDIIYEDIELSLHNRRVKVNKQSLTLTGTEFEILHLLLRDPLAIVSKETISTEVLGRRLAAYDRSIDMHVSNLRKKIAQHSSHERILTVRGAGYVMVGGQ